MAGEAGNRRRTYVVLAVLCTVLVAGLVFFGGASSPRDLNASLMQEVRVALEAYGTREGELPETLEALVASGDLGALPEDRWGSELQWERTNRTSGLLSSFGPDREAGGMMFKRDQRLEIVLKRSD